MLRWSALTALLILSLNVQGQGRGIPGLTDQQSSALLRMAADLAPQTQALTSERAALTVTAFAEPPDRSNIEKQAEAVRVVELALARKRADAFAELQTSSNKLNPNQVTGLIAAGGVFQDRPDQRDYCPGGTIPQIRETQVRALTRRSILAPSRCSGILRDGPRRR